MQKPYSMTSGKPARKTVHGGRLPELVLVQNASGFQLSLGAHDPAGYQTMIAINDDDADGNALWLWGIDVTSLKDAGVLYVSGFWAYDMALRLQYDHVPVTHVEPGLSTALQHFIAEAGDHPKRIYCTHTAMLAINHALSMMSDRRTAL